MALSAGEVEAFRSNGYHTWTAPLFTPAEVDEYRAAYTDCLDRLAAAEEGGELRDISRPPRPGHKVHQIRAAHLKHAAFDRLIRDRRITDAVTTPASSLCPLRC